jgi:hypothetical protein
LLARHLGFMPADPKFILAQQAEWRREQVTMSSLVPDAMKDWRLTREHCEW